MHLYCLSRILNIGAGIIPDYSTIDCKRTCELISPQSDKSFHNTLNQLCYFLQYYVSSTHVTNEEITSCINLFFYYFII